MKAVQILEPGKISVVEQPMPKISDDYDVLVRVRRVGICGSDVHIYHGKNPFATYPRIFGHEFVGEVVETGSKVSAVKAGDPVVCEPILSCGQCYACRSGRGNVCESLKVFGVHIDGGCREYIVLPEKIVHKFNQDIPWDEAVLIEPLTIGAQVCYRGDIKKDDVVLIMGSGTIGLSVLLNAKIAGATCICTDIIDSKLDYAKKLGADYTINVTKQDLSEEIKKITGEMGPNVTANTVCTPQSFEEAVQLTSAAGRIVILGLGPEPSAIAQMLITKKELGIMGSRLQTKRFPVVIDRLNRGEYDLSTFVTQRYPITQAEEAFHFACDHPNEVRKIVIEL